MTPSKWMKPVNNSTDQFINQFKLVSVAGSRHSEAENRYQECDGGKTKISATRYYTLGGTHGGYTVKTRISLHFWIVVV